MENPNKENWIGICSSHSVMGQQSRPLLLDFWRDIALNNCFGDALAHIWYQMDNKDISLGASLYWSDALHSLLRCFAQWPSALRC